MRRPLIVGAASVLLVACSGNGTPAATDDNAVIVTTTAPPSPDVTTTEAVVADTTTDTTTDTVTGTSGDAARPTDPPTTTGPATTEPPPVVGDPVVQAIEIGRFEQPLDLVPRPGSAGFYVVGQRGTVVHWDDGTTTPAIDLAGRLSDGGEQGLLGLAFSPDGTAAYLDFTDRDGSTNIAEYQVRADGTFDPATERILLTVEQPQRNHNAGDLEFGPDDLLYITLGDGGGGGDPQRTAQDPTTLLGSLLRIDPTPSADAPYTIPADNPFADGATVDGIAGAPEVFAWGLRNPWKIAFDPVTDELWIADVGQGDVEEVDVVGPSDDRPAGWAHDFGWSAFEGDRRYNEDVPALDRMTPPVLTYPHENGACSITGGVPYRGSAIPELEPAYVYSDYCAGTVWALDVAGQRNLVLLTGFTAVTALRADAEGEIYLLEGGGTVWKLVPG